MKSREKTPILKILVILCQIPLGPMQGPGGLSKDNMQPYCRGSECQVSAQNFFGISEVELEKNIKMAVSS